MSTLILLMCLNSMSSCDEHNARAVWRAEMQNLQCQDKVPQLVRHIQDNNLNPVNGYYVVSCEPVQPLS